MDDSWERPRPAIGRQDVVLAVGIGVVALLSLELVRSSGGLERTDVPVWSQWLVVLSGALLLLGRRRWPLVVAILAAGHMFVAGVVMPQLMGQLSSHIVYFVATLSGVAWARTTDAGVDDLPGLVAKGTGDGLLVSLDIVESPEGAALRLPRGIGLAVYSTVPEALTNVRRHSSADTVSVVVRIDETRTAPFAEVEVVDNGRPRARTSGSGLSQLGIRERTATHDGQVEIGPRVAGGYRVRVRYPVGAESGLAP